MTTAVTDDPTLANDVLVVAPADARRRGLLSPLIWAPLVVLFVVLIAWQIGVFHRVFGLKLFTVPYPTDIVDELGANLPDVVAAFGVTLPAALIGYAIGIATGFSIAGALGRWAHGIVSRVLPLLSSVNAMPIAAMAPLAALWFGQGFVAKLVVIIFITTP